MADKLKCAHCPETPQVKCYCLEQPIALCSHCAVEHFLGESSLPHRPFPVEMVESAGQQPCEMCKLAAASKICTCMFPWIAYCAECAAVHLGIESGQSKHSLEPLNAADFLQSASDLASFYERQHFVEELQAEIQRNLLTLANCTAQVNTVAEQLVREIQGWRDNALRALGEVQERIIANVALGNQQLEELRYQRVVNPNTRLEQLLTMCTRDSLPDLKPELSMLRFSFDPDRFLSQTPNLLRFAENFLMLEPLNKLFYAVPRTNKLVTFDLPSLTPRETVLNTDFKFKSASAWCNLPSGEVFLCGGVRQLKGATYYKEAILINPSTAEVQPLPSMQVQRCRHAVIHYKDSVFVFGGYNDKLLKSCEKFEVLSNGWTNLPALREGMDCVSVSIWRDQAYIVGYGSNKVAVFDFSTGNMSLLPVSFRGSVINMLLPKHCALLCVSNSEMVILLEAELVRVSIDGHSSRTEQVPGKPERAWYTQCQPAVVRGEEVLFFTLEQELWRLSLGSNDVKLILTIK